MDKTERIICGALRNLVPFVQFKNVKSIHGGVLILVKLQAELTTYEGPILWHS